MSLINNITALHFHVRCVEVTFRLGEGEDLDTLLSALYRADMGPVGPIPARLAEAAEDLVEVANAQLFPGATAGHHDLVARPEVWPEPEDGAPPNAAASLLSDRYEPTALEQSLVEYWSEPMTEVDEGGAPRVISIEKVLVIGDTDE